MKETITDSHILLLYKAWKLRRNCAELSTSVKSASITGGTKVKVALPDLAILERGLSATDETSAAGLFLSWSRHQNRTNLSPNRKPRIACVATPRYGHATRQQTLLESQSINHSSNDPIHDHDNQLDLEFMHALQDVCIERYARLGLSIEANPSSNVYIGQLQAYSEHPIFRWHPVRISDLKAGGPINLYGLRKRKIDVTINTDDPGVIPTTIRMEYHLMHEAALERGYTKLEADEWLNCISQLARTHFSDAH
ncbi:hypothetical protein [Stenotrophomonas sp. 2619]|uniref:hypothetical protein n=1 Tax=Stenotrophomonas sp. 2619 TaxID=3156316 RepID=UPI00339A85A3